MTETHAVTGPFGYSGRRIATRLLEEGVTVRGLTNSPGRASPLAGRIEVQPLCFDDPARLTTSLRGATVLYNTYWIRFNHRSFSRSEAVANSLILFEAARAAGVRRIVHVSIANPSEDSPFEYYRGKARLERAIRDSGLSYAILRPAVLFGDEDILVNNMAWVLRKFPVVGLFGSGRYGIRPIHVDDFAELAVTIAKADENSIRDAVGPERFSYRGLLEQLAAILGLQRLIVPMPAVAGYLVGRVAGYFVHDVILTRDEIGALMAGLLDSAAEPSGATRLTDWAAKHAHTLGRRYASELARRRDRTTAYT